MSDTKIYKKVGRRYKEIGACENESIYYPHGSHLVICRPGSTLTNYNVAPEYAAVEAALERVRDAMTDAMHKATEMAPEKRRYTQRELKGIAALNEIAGPMHCIRFEGTSMRDVIEAGIKILREAV